jgi:hypothetical protein
MQTLAFLLARLSEPSSYAGLGAILALAGLHFSDSELGQLAQLLAAGCGFAALLLKERGIAPVIVLVVLAGMALGACAPLAGAGAAAGVLGGSLALADQVAGTVDAVIETACGEYQKGRTAADAIVATGLTASDVANKVSVIEEYGDAVCGGPPPDGLLGGDAVSTAIWLGRLVGQIATLTDTKPAS